MGYSSVEPHGPEIININYEEYEDHKDCFLAFVLFALDVLQQLHLLARLPRHQSAKLTRRR